MRGNFEQKIILKKCSKLTYPLFFPRLFSCLPPAKSIIPHVLVSSTFNIPSAKFIINSSFSYSPPLLHSPPAFVWKSAH